MVQFVDLLLSYRNRESVEDLLKSIEGNIVVLIVQMEDALILTASTAFFRLRDPTHLLGFVRQFEGCFAEFGTPTFVTLHVCLLFVF